MFSKQEKLALFNGLYLDKLSLAVYFQRIGYEGKPETNLDTIRALHHLHPQAIPFENIDPFLETPVSLKMPAIFNKLVKQGRGGFCFEQNLLFGAVLSSIGFEVKGLSARVFWEIGEGEVRPRDHMLLITKVEGVDYLLDVGFGATSFSAPLILNQVGIQDTGDHQYRINFVGGFYYLEILIKNTWRLMHRFGLENQMLPDYEVVSWYLCTFPKSVFIHELMVARNFPGGRYTLHDNQFTIHKINEPSVKKSINNANEIVSLLEEKFLITLPESERLMEKINGLIS